MGQVRAQRKRPGRFPFSGELRATELDSGRDVWAETTDLSRGGCYVLTRQPFPQGALLRIEIRKQGARFLTDARVAYAFKSEGMGLSFLNVPAGQLPTLENWLSILEREQPAEAPLEGTGR